MRRVLGVRIKGEAGLRRTAPTLDDPYEYRDVSKAELFLRSIPLVLKPGPAGGHEARAILERMVALETMPKHVRGYHRSFWTRRRLLAWTEIYRREVARADAVAVWNGYNNPKVNAARLAAESMGKPLAFLEWGLMPETLQVDARGINNGSTLADLTVEDLLAAEIPEAAFAAVDEHVFRQRPLGVFDDGQVAEGLLPIPDLPRDYVLYAAQVHGDTQLQLFSPDFATVEDAIRYTAAECRAAGLGLVVKEHPQDDGYLSNGSLKKEMGDVVFLRNVDNDRLIAGCRAFVTINSSMALQAVRAGKPVFTLGGAVYNVPGVARRVRPSESLAELLREPEREADASTRRRYLAYLLGVALLPWRVGDPTNAQVRSLAERIRDVAFDRNV